MEQRKVDFSLNPHKKKERPKSAFLTWILNSTSATATTGRNKNDEDDKEDQTSSGNMEIRERDQYMMNSSFSTPTAVGSYTQLNYRQDPPPSTPIHKVTYTPIKGPNIIIQQSQDCDMKKGGEEIQIPNRRQSHLYTPFHETNTLSGDNDNYTYNNTRRSYYVSNLAPIDTDISNASLSRSATWQPSSSSNNATATTAINNNNIALLNTPGNSNCQYLGPQTDIPARRTSRNYANNPEIQAKLDAMFNSDRAHLLSTVIHNYNVEQEPVDTANNNNTIIYRRSTTPGNRLL
ncbi:unnamed protein product [Mucor hiemalis]